MKQIIQILSYILCNFGGWGELYYFIRIQLLKESDIVKKFILIFLKRYGAK